MKFFSVHEQSLGVTFWKFLPWLWHGFSFQWSLWWNRILVLGFCEHNNEPRQGISWVMEWLLASQEGLCPGQLFNSQNIRFTFLHDTVHNQRKLQHLNLAFPPVYRFRSESTQLCLSFGFMDIHTDIFVSTLYRKYVNICKQEAIQSSLKILLFLCSPFGPQNW
jgi:hypothetical protein